MKLAEAQAERSDCQNKIEERRNRLIRSVRVQEVDKSVEDMPQLLAETERTFSRQVEWLAQSTAPTRKSHSIASERFPMLLPSEMRRFLVGIAEAASARQDRYSRSEVRFVANVSVGKLQAEVDQLAKRYRDSDTELQELNWKTELI